MGRLKQELLLHIRADKYRTVQELAREAGRFRSSVSRALNQLVKAGLVRKGEFWELTPEGAGYAGSLGVVRKKAQGHILWTDDLAAGYGCVCDAEEALLVMVDDPVKCPNCGRQYILEQVTRVWEIIS